MIKEQFPRLVLFILMSFAFFQNESKACHLASLTIVGGPTSLGGNDYSITVQICTGSGGTPMGLLCGTAAIGNTQNYNITATGAYITSTSDTSITSGFNGVVSTSSITSGILYYTSPSTIYNIPGASDSCNLYGAATQWCWNVTFVTSGLPTSITVNGIEAVDNGQSPPPNGCSLSAAVPTAAVNGLTINSISAYPNPFRDQLIVTLKTPNATIDIYNLSGQKIESQITNALTCKLDLSHLANGVYVIQVKTADGLLRKKITKAN